MRILQISSAKSFGGGEKHLADLSKGLAQKGHDVFIALRPNIAWEEKLSFLPEKNFFKIPLRNSLDILSARKLAKVIRENDIEIIHSHLARDYSVAGFAARFAGQGKFILTRHVLFPMNSLHKFALNNLSKAIAVSNSVEKQLKQVLPSEKIIRIYNGIDTNNFESVNHEKLRREFRFEHNIPFDAPFIGTIGELKILKGQRDFVLAAQAIAKKFPEARFAIIGKENSFKQDFRRELKRMVKVFNLENHFLWLDWIEDTAPFLHALDIFVSASHTESFGLAILEAMASSTPIAATETEGAKELLNSENLVPIENPVCLANEICSLLENEESRVLLTQKNLIRAKTNFSLDRMICETEKTYFDLLN